MLAPLIVLLALYNNLLNLLPSDLHDQLYVPLNLSMTVLLVAWARKAGLSWEELGLSRTHMVPSAARGLVVGILIPAPLFLALLFPGQADSVMDDPRLEGAATIDLIYQVLVRIPIGTALFEETAFRGVLFGAWRKAHGLRNAVLGSSLVFGLWHITPTFNMLRDSYRLDGVALLALGVLGAVLVTFVGGLFFSWLRWRTKGIHGPILTHWLISSLAATAAFVATR